MIQRKWQLAILTIIFLFMLGACSKEEKQEPTDASLEELEKTEEDQDQQAVSAEKGTLFYQAPFTGEEKEEKQNQRVVVATINNHPRARPQSGIGQADMIYEFLAEGNMTRLLALFQSEYPEQIGPIRSARDYFVQLAKGMDAFYIAHGYSPSAEQLLRNQYVEHVNGMQYDGTLFQRSSDRVAPHNSYISGENVRRALDQMNARTELTKTPPLTFHEKGEDDKMGEDASEIVVRFSSDPNFMSTFQYDPSTGLYERFVNGQLTIDRLDEKPLTVANILVLEAHHQTVDHVGRLTVDLQSGGKALLFQGGTVQEVRWENIDGFLMPVDNSGYSKLMPGQTWVHIIPTYQGVKEAVTYSPSAS